MKECIICDSSNVKFVKSKGFYDIMQCFSCGLTYSSPMKSQEDYSQEITRDRWEFKLVIDLVKRLANNQKLDNIKVFEAGCGDGRFLVELKNLGCECYGIDINPNGVAKAKQFGLNVFNDTLTGDFSKRFENRFDIIFAFHILEHIDNLGDFISNLNKIIKPGGFLILSTPNPERLSKRIFLEDWDSPPYLLTKWTKKSMSLFLENNGFKVENFFEEPLSIKSKYIFIVDSAITIESIIKRTLKLITCYNNQITAKEKKLIIKHNKNKIKRIVRESINLVFYAFGNYIFYFFFFLKKIKILPKRLDKGLSLVVVAKK